MINGYLTINTDAGFLPNQKIGAYAYWIRGGTFFEKGSGLFKASCSSSHDAEKKAVINALTIVNRLKIQGLKKIIVNRDNLTAKADRNGCELQKMIYDLLNQIYIKSEFKLSINEFYEFRHVKAHKHTKNSRHWVNDWCDKQCTYQLNQYKINLKRKNNDRLFNFHKRKS